jgi:Mg-chelatase subunit ChlD
MNATASILARLGLVLNGTNNDLGPLAPEENESPKGSDSDDENEDSDEDDENEDDESGSGDDEDESEDDREQGGSGEEDEEGEDESEDSDESEKGSSGDDSDEDKSDDEDGESDDDEDGDSSDDGDSDDESDDMDFDGDDSESGEDSDDRDEGDDAEDLDAEDREKEEGGGGDESEQEDINEEEVAQALMDAMEAGEKPDLSDSSSALEDAVKGQDDDDLERNEQVWRPWAPEKDKIRVVSTHKASAAQQMQRKAKRVSSAIASKLRNKFLQARTRSTLHGVRRGQGLSERRLVDSMVELRANRRPTRPDWQETKKPECTIACAVVIDQSGSMGGDRIPAATAGIAIATAMDKLGSPCLVVGPRSGHYSWENSHEDPNYYTEGTRRPRYHRTDGVILDIFKGWDEPMTSALSRFGSIKADGCTPLSDGIQYAMQELNTRKETHRIIMVITDGWPDCPNVVRYQIRVAKEAGVEIVGVGISSGCSSVGQLFPMHVAVGNIEKLPAELLSVLDQIMFPKKGRKIKLEAQYNKNSRKS